MPGSQPIEIQLGESQARYVTVPTVVMETETGTYMSRWRLCDEERRIVAAGGDIVLQQLTFKNPFQPVNLQVVMPNQMPLIAEDYLEVPDDED